MTFEKRLGGNGAALHRAFLVHSGHHTVEPVPLIVDRRIGRGTGQLVAGVAICVS
ncbi:MULTISPECIES: hypothetical protein [Rhizobium]|uniref:Uncharacterized protein n=1 Tax=Rhizobium indicum TaxID=2583231 RepID=A0ABX6PIR8_9HYPH|nr:MULTISPECIES: hypothetical protein [Rhizobium]MBA1347616.1 hypothetical protein [Rhizobium sp. WYCCWR 11146]NYT29123.1 hypothetical protein [Rhizobium sp. WYCCWR 11128]QKK18994.1 hypothetical protein FFM53_022155 [Rhizobium indicum]